MTLCCASVQGLGGYVASNGRGAALRTCTAGGRATTAGCVKGAISANDAVLSGASNRRPSGLRSFRLGCIVVLESLCNILRVEVWLFFSLAKQIEPIRYPVIRCFQMASCTICCT